MPLLRSELIEAMQARLSYRYFPTWILPGKAELIWP